MIRTYSWTGWIRDVIGSTYTGSERRDLMGKPHEDNKANPDKLYKRYSALKLVHASCDQYVE